MDIYLKHTMISIKKSIQTMIIMHLFLMIKHFEAQYLNLCNSFLLSMQVHQSRCAIVQTTLRESSIFSSLCKAQNLDSSRGLVKILASCFSVLTWWILISPLASWSLKKWCRMSMCLVLECLTGLLANFMALSLSHKSGILVKWHPKS